MKVNDPADHALFIEHQASFDLAIGALSERTWDGFIKALEHSRLVDGRPL